MSLRINDLFDKERIPSAHYQKWLFYIYLPIGFIIFFLRLGLGIQMFLIACILRKNYVIRSAILRIYAMLMGIVIVNKGPVEHWDNKTRLMVANHITAIDHFAIELSQSCTLPSIWDIPNFLRWTLGYVDLGAKKGREEFVKQVKAYLAHKHEECNASDTSLPLLSFPEGCITNGNKGLLKFSSWPFEVAETIQPIALTMHRPIFSELKSTVIGSPWWEDVLFFMLLPVSIIHINWLSPMHKKPDETSEEFADRCSSVLSAYLEIEKTSFTSSDVNEALRRIFRESRNNKAMASGKIAKNNVTEANLNSWALKIKQAHPKIHLSVLKDNLRVTKDPGETINIIMKGGLISESKEAYANSKTLSEKLLKMPKDVRRLLEDRKWDLIERNRKSYLDKSRKLINNLKQQLE
ncbi:Ancient ubiquitous protein 1 [Strongyloides ratti]|uniref:Ancient ubiquitous protein 1 n=1 Tax=Strongyloides ratti TaxID=34506 RepID=A0A090LA34_STRRB|nr:Ancient ubiquitous protein 1 [Strongyloides ratti]CEF64370.1 Ancient ubiquitous protein 1 [Strongyloides ratti]